MNKLILTALLFTVFACGEQKKETIKMSGRYKDIFEVYEAKHTISHHYETITLYNSMPITKMSRVIKNAIKECNKLHQLTFENKKIQKAVEEYISKSVQYFKNLEKYRKYRGERYQNTFFKIIYDYDNYEDKFNELVKKEFSMESFVHLSEKDYWKNIDKSNFIKSKDYSKYKALKKYKFKESQKLLEKIIASTTNFQEFSIYKIESADELVKRGLKGGLKKYEEIFNKKEYSLYLFEAWMKWRAVYQSEHGGESAFAKIDNKLYDAKRKEIANVIFDYISKHKKDKMAINQFLALASHDIVRIYGEYPYGNQSIVEFHSFFLSEFYSFKLLMNVRKNQYESSLEEKNK